MSDVTEIVDMFNMSRWARCVANDAVVYAMENGDITVRTEHLLMSLIDGMSDTVIGELLAPFEGITVEGVLREQAVWRSHGHIPGPLGREQFKATPKFDHVVLNAIRRGSDEAAAHWEGELTLPYLLMGIALEPNGVGGRFLALNGADYVYLRDAIEKRRRRIGDMQLERMLGRRPMPVSAELTRA